MVSLGIFALFLGLLLFALLFYLLLKLLAVRVQCCNTVRNILQAKLFYSVWIRYMIESNLKITHNCIFFLVIGGSFETGEDGVSTIFRIVLLILICVWPVFAAVFLCIKKEKLE